MADNTKPSAHVDVSDKSKTGDINIPDNRKVINAEVVNINEFNTTNPTKETTTLNKKDQNNRDVLIWNVQNKWIDSFLNAPCWMKRQSS